MWAAGSPAQVEPLLDAIPLAFERVGAKPSRMIVSDRRIHRVRYSPAALREAALDPLTTDLSVYAAVAAPQTEVQMFLREKAGFKTTRRHVYVASESAEPGAVGPWKFLEEATRQYPILHGGALRANHYYDASAEAALITVSGSGGMEQQRINRIGFDSMNQDDTKLRRLYPTTIIGPAIWAKLPPLPALERMPTVRDLGDCKVLEAWPTLVDVEDPQFLLGTRELRRWLWPYTIQNPADDPDEVDRRLKWMDLLPW